MLSSSEGVGEGGDFLKVGRRALVFCIIPALDGAPYVNEELTLKDLFSFVVFHLPNVPPDIQSESQFSSPERP